MSGAGTVLQDCSAEEIALIAKAAKYAGDSALHIMEAAKIPVDRGIELAQRASILDLASGMAASQAQHLGDPELRLQRAIQMLTHAYRHMALGLAVVGEPT